MPVALRDRLEAQAKRIEPVQAVERQARRFEHRPDIPDVDRGDYEAYNQALTEARVAAVKQALERDGLEAVLRLAAASRLPGAVGDALALASEDEHAQAILPLLEGTDAEVTLASGFIRRRNFPPGLSGPRTRRPRSPSGPRSARSASCARCRPAVRRACLQSRRARQRASATGRRSSRSRAPARPRPSPSGCLRPAAHGRRSSCSRSTTTNDRATKTAGGPARS